MPDTPELPPTLVRRCCSGKPCTTTLDLESIEVGTAPGESPVPPLYRYVRGNGNIFGPDWSSAQRLAAWVEESAAEDAASDEYQRAAAAEEAAYLAERDER